MPRINDSTSNMSMALAQFFLPGSVFLLNDQTNSMIRLIPGIAVIRSVISQEVTDGTTISLLSLFSIRIEC